MKGNVDAVHTFQYPCERNQQNTSKVNYLKCESVKLSQGFCLRENGALIVGQNDVTRRNEQPQLQVLCLYISTINLNLLNPNKERPRRENAQPGLWRR